HSSIAMFISEIPVRYYGEKSIKWIKDLNNQTTVKDIILSVLPSCDPKNYSLYIRTGRYRQILNNSSYIYKIVASFNQQYYARRLFFEIRSKKISQLNNKKHVRFADEIIIQNIQGRCCISNEKLTSNMIETISIPIEKRLENLKENFQKYVQHKQENYIKLSSISKRSTLNIINENIPKHVCVQKAIIRQISCSSSESGISSSGSNDDFLLPTTMLETLV
ncbi:unnamed protein product, partial [Rotaria sp. Silwood1]